MFPARLEALLVVSMAAAVPAAPQAAQHAAPAASATADGASAGGTSAAGASAGGAAQAPVVCATFEVTERDMVLEGLTLVCRFAIRVRVTSGSKVFPLVHASGMAKGCFSLRCKLLSLDVRFDVCVYALLPTCDTMRLYGEGQACTRARKRVLCVSLFCLFFPLRGSSSLCA